MPPDIMPEPVIVVAPPDPPPAAPDPQLNVHTAVADMADVLRAKDYVTYIVRYWPPELTSQMGPERLAQLAKNIADVAIPGSSGDQEFQELVRILDGLKNTKPTLGEFGGRATATYEGTARPGGVRFIQIDGRWYFLP